jgi:biopolymer transport protein ExbD
MWRRRGRASEEQGVDMSPLIDMVFILLIFFMVTTTFVKDAQVELDRPSASSAKPASTKAIRVTLDRRGEVWVDGRPVRAWMLQGSVREQLRSGADRPVLVITDGAVAAQKLIDVIDECRLAGARDVAVATEKEAG